MWCISWCTKVLSQSESGALGLPSTQGNKLRCTKQTLTECHCLYSYLNESLIVKVRVKASIWDDLSIWPCWPRYNSVRSNLIKWVTWPLAMRWAFMERETETTIWFSKEITSDITFDNVNFYPSQKSWSNMHMIEVWLPTFSLIFLNFPTRQLMVNRYDSEISSGSECLRRGLIDLVVSNEVKQRVPHGILLNGMLHIPDQLQDQCMVCVNMWTIWAWCLITFTPTTETNYIHLLFQPSISDIGVTSFWFLSFYLCPMPLFMCWIPKHGPIIPLSFAYLRNPKNSNAFVMWLNLW